MSSLQSIAQSHSWTTSPAYQKARQAHHEALQSVNRAFVAYRAIADEAARTEGEEQRTALYESSDQAWKAYTEASLRLEMAGDELLRASGVSL